jgi:hypothetical protein
MNLLGQFNSHYRRSWRLARAMADDSERRLLLAVGVGGGVAVSGGIGIATASLSAVSGLAVAVLVAAPLVPAGGLLGAWVWRGHLRRTFPNVSIDQYLDVQELVRKEFQQELRDIRDMQLDRAAEDKLKIAAFRKSRARLTRMLASAVADAARDSVTAPRGLPPPPP